MTTTTLKVLGTTDEVTACECCGRSDLKGTVVLSDPDGKVGKRYGAFDSKYKLDNRTLYVIAPGGKISYVASEFQEVDPQAYVALGEAVGKTMGDSTAN